jgi:hypothetical protein
VTGLDDVLRQFCKGFSVLSAFGKYIILINVLMLMELHGTWGLAGDV